MIEYKFNKISDENEKYSNYILGADIGGTYARIGIAGVKNNKPYLLYNYDFETNKIDSLATGINLVLNDLKKKYSINISNSCIGVAGVVSSNKNMAKLTNGPWEINISNIIEKTDLKSSFMINDFEALGFGMNLISDSDLIKIRPGVQYEKSTKAILGAGTGLGKSILYYEPVKNIFIPIASEGGNSDFPPYNDFEMRLVNYIKNERKISDPICYEELLSGRGLVHIYNFLKTEDNFEKTQICEEIEQSALKQILISKYKNEDDLCNKTFKLFTRFYGRCVKNLILDTMAIGGVYIAGGIALKNKEIFSWDDFLIDINLSERRRDVLEKVPIYLITNPSIGLLGACFAAIYKNQE